MESSSIDKLRGWFSQHNLGLKKRSRDASRDADQFPLPVKHLDQLGFRELRQIHGAPIADLHRTLIIRANAGQVWQQFARMYEEFFQRFLLCGRLKFLEAVTIVDTKFSDSGTSK